ncbi:UDP-N-acetylglucosamine transferase subunit ALG13 [Spathaspora sp. JA1]|nr:UDP-N-acetylglucosamine transferase subunit ALG13 [Spathaspora sp. JA1]
MTSILVTTGATVTFKSLILKVINVEFIEQLISLNVGKLYIQYGNEVKQSKHISHDFFFKQIKERGITSKFNLTQRGEWKEPGDVCIFESDKFEIITFPYSAHIDVFISKADVIISHAGTGSIIDALKLQKKLMIVVNDQLMDNHQLEIAQEFSKSKYCLAYEIKDMDEKFIGDLKKLLNNEIQLEKFPDSDGAIIEAIVYKELTS